MKLTAGDTVTLMVGTEKATLKIEDASKGDVVRTESLEATLGKAQKAVEKMLPAALKAFNGHLKDQKIPEDMRINN